MSIPNERRAGIESVKYERSDMSILLICLPFLLCAIYIVFELRFLRLQLFKLHPCSGLGNGFSPPSNRN